MRAVALVVLVALAGALAGGAVASAAPTLSPSVVGEPPIAGGVFRFPQAVAFSPGGARVYIGDQYSGVVQVFARDGTPIATFGARASRGEPGRLGTVGGIATDRDGHVYVLDSENDRVQVFAADGTFLRAFGDPSFNLSTNPASVTAGISASGIAVAQQAPGAAPVVYVADQGSDHVARFVLDPATLAPAAPTFSAAIFAAPQGVALDPAGTRVYVADDDNHRVVVLDPATLQVVTQVGSFGTGPGQFQNPYDVAVDSAGQLYVGDNLNNRVDVFDAASLAFRTTFGGFGRTVGLFSIVRSVGALADDPSGGVDVADTANNRIQALDPAGNVLAAWGIAGRGFGYVTRPGGVALAPDGTIFVADAFDHRIERFLADGAFAGQLGLISAFNGFATAGSAPGQFDTPGGVAVDTAGNVWVADTANDRVVEESTAGAVIATFPATAPQGIAAGPGGSVLVADTGARRVVRIDPGAAAPVVVRTTADPPAAVASDGAGGAFVATSTAVLDPTGAAIATPEGGLTWDRPAGLAYDPASDTLYVAERRPGTAAGARIVRRTGAVWDTIAGEGAGPGDVIDPGGLAVSADGATLLVADTGNDRVLRFDAPGRAPAPLPSLSVGVAPLTGGTVTSDPPGIGCATDCVQHFSAGAQVTLTARPAAGLVVAGWTGACAPAGAAPTCTVTMAGAQSAGATFGPPPAPAVAPAPAAPAPAPAPVRFVSVQIAPSRLHLARARDRRRHRPAQRATRARVTARATRAATLTVVVMAGRPGIRRGSECVAPPRSGRPRGARPCTRFVALRGVRTVRALSGIGRFALTPAAGGRPLAPGRYRLAITALDTSGNRVGPRNAAFVVTR